VGTAVYLPVLNTAHDYAAEGKTGELTFELNRAVEKEVSSAAKEANRANLIKANRALRERGSRTGLGTTTQDEKAA
jgi:hypothetical protein